MLAKFLYVKMRLADSATALYKELKTDMARQKGLINNLIQSQQEAKKQQEAEIQAQLKASQEAIKAQKARERASNAEKKEFERLHVEQRTAEVAFKNQQIENSISELHNLLTTSLAVKHSLNLESLKRSLSLPPFEPGVLGIQQQPPLLQMYLPLEPSGLQKMLPAVKKKYEQDLMNGRMRFEADMVTYRANEAARQSALSNRWSQYQQYILGVQQNIKEHNTQVEQLQKDIVAGNPDAVVNYFTLILNNSSYPLKITQQFKIAYIPESKQVVIEYNFPSFAIVPDVESYKYVKTKDQITETFRPLAQRKELYSSIIAQITLRTIYEIFDADYNNNVNVIVFNGFVDTLDKSTGHNRRACLITVLTTREKFVSLNLNYVEAVSCLKKLGGELSANPTDLAPVRPVLEFNMVDRRFVQELDVLTELDKRPNLMELSPTEFESLIANLFAKMGLETRVTQASRDGGVDCVAFDPRPVLGGKVVIQAKRYKNTVGVSAVRDLFGTVHNEGASKGILVTTSGFGKAAFDFSKDKPIELLSGSNLLYLLKEYAGIEAKIEVPEDWRDLGLNNISE